MGAQGLIVISYTPAAHGNAFYYLTSGSVFFTPSDWSANNTGETIGGGGGGSAGQASSHNGAGGGGGAYSLQPNILLTPGQQISYTVGANGAGGTGSGGNGSAGGDTWFNGDLSRHLLLAQKVVVGGLLRQEAVVAVQQAELDQQN